MIACALIADDLTGACDAAGRFAAAGLRTVVAVDGEFDPDADVVAISTESRDVDPAEARARLFAIAGRVRRLEPRILFKKIDSTLRGNTGHELVAAVEAFECAAAVVNPAFPSMRRIVIAGHLLVEGDRFRPIQMPVFLEEHGATPCRHAPPGAIEWAVADGIRFISMEAEKDADLDEIAAELIDISHRMLWAGSAGLAGALARRLGRGKRAAPAPRPRGPVLFCIGSDHPATVKQEKRLLKARDIATHPSAVTEGRHALLRIPGGEIEAEAVRELIAACRPAALFLSGGDTASLVCRALGVESIRVEGEFAPGIPIGTLRGGAFDGITVVTKSGGFGAPGELIRIADYFHG